MSVSKIADRYAKSIFDLAKEKGALDAVHSDMKGFLTVCQNSEFLNLIKSPIVKADKKISVFAAIFKGKVNPITEGFLNLMISKGREPFLNEIAQSFLKQFRTANGITLVKVITATPFSSEAINVMIKQLQSAGAVKSAVEIETAIDADLIGGAVLEFDNKVIDASVEYKLNQLKQSFSQNAFTKSY
jgi:F-type H+-transporting ATPase subunit delta